MNKAYRGQVQLLLDVLPIVAKEKCFALHGGTAINLFVREMPRLSVDIDLTYIHIADREQSLRAINAALQQLSERITALRNSIQIEHKPGVCKLLLNERGVQIKIEVNTVGRGLLSESAQMPLCEAAQDQFDVFCAVPVVSLAQLYGGKLCAALDRQHPRDLFDVKLLLANEGLTDDIRRGLLYGVISSNRPAHELLQPNLLDQRGAFDNQFVGMTTEPFSYEDFEATRAQLIEDIRVSLSAGDRAFLIAFNRLEPDWSENPWGEFPSVRWKLQNLANLRASNEAKYQEQLDQLQQLFEG